MNRIQVLGRVGQAPEIRKTQNGDSVANFSVAVTEKWKDAQGQKQERTEWIPVVIWGKLADIAEKYVTKGARVYIEGKFKTRSWEKDGTKVYTTECVVQGFDGNLDIIDWPEKQSAHNEAKANGYQPDDIEDSIPFMRHEHGII